MVSSLTSNGKLCPYCDHALTLVGKCYVCDTCKTVANSSGISKKELSQKIIKTVESIQNYLENESSRLHDIEQRFIFGSKLTDNETSIREFCVDFIDCKASLDLYLQDRISLNDKQLRKTLYQLLQLSIQFEEVFGTSCTELEI